MLHTLIGYSDQPSVLQVVVYAITLAIIFVLTKTVGARRTACGEGETGGRRLSGTRFPVAGDKPRSWV